MVTKTFDQRWYWYRVGYDEQRLGIEEPSFGRMNKAEEALWWAGWWTSKAGLSPSMAEGQEQTATAASKL